MTPSHTTQERLSSGPSGSNHPRLRVRRGLSSTRDLDHGPPAPWTRSWVPWWHWPGQRCGPSLPTSRKPCHLGPKYSFSPRLSHQPASRVWCPQRHQTVPNGRCTHSNAVVPALPLGFPRLDTHATTHCPPAQAMAPLDFVGNHPDLEQNLVGAPGPAAEETLVPAASRLLCPHLVQRSHRHSAHVVGDVLPTGALGIAGGDPCSVPQVPWTEKQPRSSAKSFWPILACCGVNPNSPSNPSHPRALDDPQLGAWATANPVSLWARLHNRLIVPLGADSLSHSEGEAKDKECFKQIKKKTGSGSNPWAPRLFLFSFLFQSFM